MQKVQLRERVNAVYGYNAIARIRITQTAAAGFSEGQADFDIAPETQAGGAAGCGDAGTCARDDRQRRRRRPAFGA